MKQDYQKALKKVTFFLFWNQSLPIDKIIKNKRGLKLVTSRSSGYKTSSCINQINNSFISYVLSDEVWWCNIKQFLSYSKNYICKFMQANSWHHKLFHFRLSFWIWKVWKGREKIQKFEYPENRKSFIDEIKTFFTVFEGLLFDEKKKNWQK